MANEIEKYPRYQVNAPVSGPGTAQAQLPDPRTDLPKAPAEAARKAARATKAT